MQTRYDVIVIGNEIFAEKCSAIIRNCGLSTCVLRDLNCVVNWDKLTVIAPSSIKCTGEPDQVNGITYVDTDQPILVAHKVMEELFDDCEA
jgi:hypothetical protein